MAKSTSFVLLADNGKGPPSEFRLFRRGLNRTTKGDFIFDEVSAKAVMSEFNDHGTDLMVDLEHLSLNKESNSYDPDSRAWLKLEVREGELWAVDVRWTPDGTERLTQKTQRYVSPVFYHDEDKRIVSIVNIALTSTPATIQPSQLVAATRSHNMNPELVTKAIDAIAEGDSDAAAEILKSMVAEAAGGEVPSEEPAAEPADSSPEEPAVEEMTEMPEEEEKEELTEYEEEEKKKELSALSQIREVTGVQDRTELVAEIKSLSKRIAEVDARELELELTERKQLAASLVKLGAELPSTAWVGEGKDRKLCDRLSSEDLDSLRTRVKALSACGPKKNNAPPSAAQVSLSKAELAACKARNLDPVVFAARKAASVRS